MKQVLLMSALLTGSLGVFGQTSVKDQEKIKSIFTTMENGWNSKSGEKFASVFADTHDYIVVNGMYFAGFTRQGNTAAHQTLFDGPYKNSVVKIKVDVIRSLRPDLAIVTAFGTNNHMGGELPKDPTIIMTVLVEKKNEEWKIISFHNHQLAIEPGAAPMPLNVMFASWYK